MTDSKTQAQQVKKLKHLLEGWRMAIVQLKAVLLWEQHWHPAAIFATNSALHLVIWLLEPNFVMTIAIMGLIITFLDFIVPLVYDSMYSPRSWTGQMEKTYESICQSIVASYNQLARYVAAFCSLREGSPWVYYAISISMLCSIAWMSSIINNIFLLYVLSTITLFWPGVQHRGIFNTILVIFDKLEDSFE